MEKISNSLDSENDYSRDEFDLISLYFGEAEQLPFDKEEELFYLKNLLIMLKLKIMFYLLVWVQHSKCGILIIMKTRKKV